MESFSSADMFQEDVVGSLLPLLSIADVRSLLLTCKAFKTAIKHQLRILSPLYLPVATRAAWSSLESLHLHLSRSSTDRYSEQEARVSPFTWLAPIRTFSSLNAFHHTAQMDLSSQLLPANASELLSRHLTRLRALNLDGCKLPMAAMLEVTGITTLRSLSVSGIQLTGSLPAETGRQESQLSAQPHEAAGSSGSHAAKAISREEASRILDAICQLQLEELRMDLKASIRGSFGLPHVAPFIHGHGIPLLNNASKLVAMSNLEVLSLINSVFNANDWETLCDAVGPKLQELHITWGFKDPEHQEDLNLTPDVFSHISKLTNLRTLTLEMSSCQRSDPYTLFPVANTLTELKLKGPASIPLVLSLTECSKVVRLELSGLTEAALNELHVQVVSSMPMLRSLRLCRLQEPDRGQAGLQPTGDCLLPYLDTCCLHLTELWMPDLMLNGTGLRLVAAAASDTLNRTFAPAAGGVRSCQHIELSAMHMMRSAFPHLSCLTGLQSLTLHDMPQKQFPHLCKLGCLNTLAALTNLTSLRILPVINELAKWEKELKSQQGAEANGGIAVGGNAAGLAGQAAAAVAAAEQLLGDYPGENEGDEAEAEDISEAEENGDNSEAEDSDNDMEEADTEGDEEGDGGPQQQQQLNEWVHMAVEEPDLEPDDEEDEDDPAGLAAAQQAANQAVQALAEELQHEAGILANNPAQQVLAGGAFQAVAQMLLPQGMVGHLAGPGAVAAQAAVAAVQDLAVQLAQNAAPGPEGAGAVAAVQNALQAVAAGEGAQQQQAPAIPYAGMYGLRHHPFEPHLHFLDTMTALVNLELSCLQTTGLCFLHLSNLQSLQSLVLGGVITFEDDSWGYLAGLGLPGVTSLSLTGCSVRAAGCVASGGLTSVASAASTSRNGSSGTAGATGSGPAGASTSAAASGGSGRLDTNTCHGAATGLCGGSGNLGMGNFVHAVCCSFPGVVNLELGSCRFLTKSLLVQLAIGLRQLERLRLLGVAGAALFVADVDNCAGAAASNSDSTEQQQLMPQASNRPDTAWRPLFAGNRCVGETQSAIKRLSSLARRREAATCLKYVEVCEAEIPRGVIDVDCGLEDGARYYFAGRSVPFVWHEQRLTPWRP